MGLISLFTGITRDFFIGAFTASIYEFIFDIWRPSSVLLQLTEALIQFTLLTATIDHLMGWIAIKDYDNQFGYVITMFFGILLSDNMRMKLKAASEKSRASFMVSPGGLYSNRHMVSDSQKEIAKSGNVQ